VADDPRGEVAIEVGRRLDQALVGSQGLVAHVSAQEGGITDVETHLAVLNLTVKTIGECVELLAAEIDRLKEHTHPATAR
jgi:hypothetical protein